MGKYINWARTVRRLGINKIKEFLFSKKQQVDNHLVNEILGVVRKEGVYVYENFLSKEKCEMFKKEIDAVLEKENPKIWKDSLGSDTRCFGINRLSKFIDVHFYNEPRIVALREAFLAQKDERILGFSMANKLVVKENNLGSGLGWHRDTVNESQFKVILYVTDVGEKNGAFQYLKGSHKKQSVLDGILEYNFDYNHNRLKDIDIDNYLKTGKYNLITPVGKAGTLLVVDTSGIHRGMPIEEGERYALTNYYALPKKIGGSGLPKHILNLLVEN
ncbi:phytanoyl-CoA dioxygenase family protein [Aureispira sp. CCB-E]|uniref:phytanoyl-CoA dioxygenase family protein n=1 Tax=Aureispira sp. CCB-E TaxID=3051121 RepID=UPI0028695213|nr:phytanoyl-CoA dioxygenase family protein [Aureispira sp. CCB-E]WMX16012.1 phytanoyl-CoA dioxygenase family protein [Aureispira sp. CCB-E]